MAPISTELHRYTLSSNADAYAIINCDPLIVGSDIDISALDKDRFVAGLSNLTTSRRRLHLVCRYQLRADADKSRRKRLNQQLRALADLAGFQEVKVSETRTSVGWAEAYQIADKFNQSGEAKEPLFEDEYVRAFSIRTRLSKFLFGQTDCIVEVIHPIDGLTKKISADLESSIRKAVNESRPAEFHTLLFELTSTADSSEAVEVLFDTKKSPEIPLTTNAALRDLFESLAAKYEPSPALVLAQDLGFQDIRYSLSSGGGAPESLMSMKAPDFTLSRIDGTPLALHQHIRGRPALITFWGLACAPCRREAPFLTAMHEKCADEFAIVAVNAYNDDREAVAKYVDNDALTHEIVLQGKSTAEAAYHVGAHPTTFWVDHRGTVVDYEIGFTSSKSMESRIEKLLLLE